MNIIFVSTEFVTKNKPSTGLPNYLYRVAKALINNGDNPIIVTCGEYDEHVTYHGIEVYRVTVGCDFFDNEILDYITYAIYNSFKLNQVVKKICKKTKIDIIQYTSLGGMALFYSVNIPAVIRLSSYAKVYYGSNATFSKAYINTMSAIEAIASWRMKGIFSPSNVMAKGFAKDTHKKVAVIETLFENDVKTMDHTIYNEKFINKKYILFFGSLYAEKGIFVIAEILNKILKENPDYYFAFIGNVKIIADRNPIKELTSAAGKYKDRLIFMEALNHDKLYPIVSNAELVVLPSIMENLSNACIEAMYFGRIVVGTEGTSFEQLITDGENGFLVRPGDSNSLYKGIRKSLDLPSNIKSNMSLKAKKRIEDLRPEYIIKKLIRYYNYIISK